MTPAEGALCFGYALVFGVGLGVCYDVLRPLRPRWLWDFGFILLCFWAFLLLGFGVCQGDIRLGYNLGLFCGALGWKITLGRLFGPFMKKFFQKWEKYGKFLLAKLRKAVTMKGKSLSNTIQTRF